VIVFDIYIFNIFFDIFFWKSASFLEIKGKKVIDAPVSRVILLGDIPDGHEMLCKIYIVIS